MEDGRSSGFTDEGLAPTFTDRHGATLRYVAGWGRWMQWTGNVWKADGTLHVLDLSRAICRHASMECNEAKVAAAIASQDRGGGGRLAKVDRQHAAMVEQWDADPWLLNTRRDSGVHRLSGGEGGAECGRPACGIGRDHAHGTTGMFR